MLDPLSLLAPNGPISPKLFPREGRKDLAVRMERYVENAYDDSRIPTDATDATKDRMARALALHTAFKDVWIRMSAEPLTVNVSEKGSHGYSAAQLANMKQLADDYLAEFEALIPVVADVSTAAGGTRSIRNTFVF